MEGSHAVRSAAPRDEVNSLSIVFSGIRGIFCVFPFKKRKTENRVILLGLKEKPVSFGILWSMTNSATKLA